MDSMSEPCYLAIDLGAEIGRVVAGLFDGQTMRLEELHRFSNGPVQVGGTLRWNVLGLWQGIQHGLTLAASRFGDSIQSIGVDTWGVDYVLLSAEDELLGLPWHYRDDRTAGMLATAGDLVFSGTVDGYFFALDAVSGEELWHVNVGSLVHAAPMSYAVDGKQYVTIAAGNVVFTFGLPD